MEYRSYVWFGWEEQSFEDFYDTFFPLSDYYKANKDNIDLNDLESYLVWRAKWGVDLFDDFIIFTDLYNGSGIAPGIRVYLDGCDYVKAQKFLVEAREKFFARVETMFSFDSLKELPEPKYYVTTVCL